jgi:4-amino-4-deoxy-L-arabinose transferase-like glycosyltransferase
MTMTALRTATASSSTTHTLDLPASRLSRERLALAFILALGALLRLWTLDTRDFWTDEAGKIATARLPFEVFWTDIFGYEQTPPLYFLLVRATVALLGDSLFSYRLLSCAAGIGTIWVTYRLARALFTPVAGLTAAALVSVSPYFIWHSQDANTYSVLGFLCALSVWRLWEALQRPSTVTWALFALPTALAVYLQHYAWLLAAFEGAYVLLVYVPAHRRLPHRWYVGAVLVALLYVPHAGVLATQYGAAQYKGYTRRPPFEYAVTLVTNTLNLGNGYRLKEFRDALREEPRYWAALRGVEAALAILAPITVAALGAFLSLRAGLTRGLFVLILFAGPSLLGATTLFQSRHAIIAGAPYFVLLAAGITLVRGAGRTGLLTALLVVSGISLFHHYASPWSRTKPQDWRGAAARVADGARPGDIVTVHAQIGGAFAYAYHTWKIAPDLGTGAADASRLPSVAPASWGVIPPREKELKPTFTWEVSADRKLVETTLPRNADGDTEAARLADALCATCRLWIIYDHWEPDGWPQRLGALRATTSPVVTEDRSQDLRLMVLEKKRAPA